jgi:hypothetical protein
LNPSSGNDLLSHHDSSRHHKTSDMLRREESFLA